MSKVKVSVKFDMIEALDGLLDAKTVDALGSAFHEKVQGMLDQGISPVRGQRRLERYKNPESYPGNKKPKRPVNLSLSGQMRSHMDYKQKDAQTIEYGFLSGTPNEILELAGYHQDGTPNMAARPLVPTKAEEWAVSIVRTLKEIYSLRLDSIIKKSNR